MADRARPVISVAIASRNHGRYLPRALDSVFRCQNPTHAPLQVVVADDASTDNTRAVLADYRLRFPHSLEIVSLRTSSGGGAAKNAALDRCLGRTVALLDADDEFLPEKLAQCHATLEQGGVDFVSHDYYEVEAGKTTLRSRQGWPHCYAPSAWTFRSGVLRFNPLFAFAHDMEWVERRLRRVRYRHLDRPLTIYHRYEGQLSRRWENWTAAEQLKSWTLGRPYALDELAPGVWACRNCGNQYLLPWRCCDRDAVPRPLLFYQPALSPHSRARTQFSLVMLTRNGLPLTRRAVSSLLAHLPASQRQQVEWIFVDGGSTDGTLEYVRKLARTIPVKLILTHPAEPFNYSLACNRGARAAVGEYLLLLNNDIELESEEPWEPLRAALSDRRVGVVGVSTVWNTAQKDPEWTDGEGPYQLVDRPVTGWFWGARREVFWELGGMDEAFAGYGYEELDFQYRAQLAHYYLALARVRVRHVGQGTFGRVYEAGALEKLEGENRQVFEEKYGEEIYTLGNRVEPFASRGWAEGAVVIVAGEEAAGLRESLERAEGDGECREGRMQVVVVANGSGDETATVLADYRDRLGACLTVVGLDKTVGRARAEQIGQERAVGKQVRLVAPGEWQ